MKKILVPVDFSNNAHNAYLFARDLAATIEGVLQVVHIYPGSLPEREPLVDIEKELDQLEQRLIDFTNQVPDAGTVLTDIKVNTRVIYGTSAIKKITAFSQEYDLVVMGTRREHSLKDKMFGTVASGVAQKALCPVLLIPKGASFNGFKNIIYASNWESSNKKVVAKMLDWAKTFQAKVDFNHVNSQYELKDFEKIKEEIQLALIEMNTSNFNHTFSNIADDSTISGLYRYANKKQADLIAIGNRQRKFWNNLFFTSLTKEMAMNINIPLLVFHLSEEA